MALKRAEPPSRGAYKEEIQDFLATGWSRAYTNLWEADKVLWSRKLGFINAIRDLKAPVELEIEGDMIYLIRTEEAWT